MENNEEENYGAEYKQAENVYSRVLTAVKQNNKDEFRQLVPTLLPRWLWDVNTYITTSGNVEFVQELLNLHSNGLITHDNFNMIMNEGFRYSLYLGYIEIVKLIFRYRNFHPRYLLMIKFMMTCETERFENMVKILKELDIDLNIMPCCSTEPFTKRITKEYIDRFEYMVEQNVLRNVNFEEMMTEYAQHYHVEMVEYLFGKGVFVSLEKKVANPQTGPFMMFEEETNIRSQYSYNELVSRYNKMMELCQKEREKRKELVDKALFPGNFCEPGVSQMITLFL